LLAPEFRDSFLELLFPILGAKIQVPLTTPFSTEEVLYIGGRNVDTGFKFSWRKVEVGTQDRA